MIDATPHPTRNATTLIAPDQALFDRARMAAAGFLTGYSGKTREAYTTDLQMLGDWCAAHGVPVLEVTRTHIELFARSMEDAGRAPSTISRRLSTIVCFYRWCYLEHVITEDPGRNVRRPKVSFESTTKGLDRIQMGAFLTHAEIAGGNDHALACLLALNGLRVSEACNADIEDLGSDRGHQTLAIMGKGGKPAVIPLAPRTFRAITLATAGRTSGPLMLGFDGQRLRTDAAGRITRRLGKRAGIPFGVHPHCLRHSFVTAALDAGCSLRDVQDSARHADPRMTMRYDRGRGKLDRHSTYVVSAYVAGGA